MLPAVIYVTWGNITYIETRLGTQMSNCYSFYKSYMWLKLKWTEVQEVYQCYDNGVLLEVLYTYWNYV